MKTIGQSIGLTVLMALAVQGTKLLLVSLGLDLTRAIGVLAQAVVAGAVGVLVYLSLALLFRLEEVGLLALGVSRIRGRLTRPNGENGEGDRAG
jgi:hypothetical protein